LVFGAVRKDLSKYNEVPIKNCAVGHPECYDPVSSYCSEEKHIGRFRPQAAATLRRAWFLKRVALRTQVKTEYPLRQVRFAHTAPWAMDQGPLDHVSWIIFHR
jgi:hypothetical protein